jgi:enoyl reductase-like protein
VHTSDSVQQQLAQASGIADGKWGQTYKGETDGVPTVQSELVNPFTRLSTTQLVFQSLSRYIALLFLFVSL